MRSLQLLACCASVAYAGLSDFMKVNNDHVLKELTDKFSDDDVKSLLTSARVDQKLISAAENDANDLRRLVVKKNAVLTKDLLFELALDAKARKREPTHALTRVLIEDHVATQTTDRSTLPNYEIFERRWENHVVRQNRTSPDLYYPAEYPQEGFGGYRQPTERCKQLIGIEHPDNRKFTGLEQKNEQVIVERIAGAFISYHGQLLTKTKIYRDVFYPVEFLATGKGPSPTTVTRPLFALYVSKFYDLKLERFVEV